MRGDFDEDELDDEVGDYWDEDQSMTPTFLSVEAHVDQLTAQILAHLRELEALTVQQQDCTTMDHLWAQIRRIEQQAIHASVLGGDRINVLYERT